MHRCVNELRAVASGGGVYVSESNFFEPDFEHSYWGANHARLAEIKKKYEPDGLFFVHNGVGSERGPPLASPGFELQFGSKSAGNLPISLVPGWSTNQRLSRNGLRGHQ